MTALPSIEQPKCWSEPNPLEEPGGAAFIDFLLDCGHARRRSRR